MEEGKSLEHVKNLIESVVENFFREIVVDFHISESDANIHPLNISNTLGFARPVDPEVREEFIVGLNFFQTRIPSDEAIKGAVAHEIGHIKDEYRKDTRKRLR